MFYWLKHGENILSQTFLSDDYYQDDSYADGYDDGYTDYSNGNDTSYDDGYDDGYADYSNGDDTSYDDSYDGGYTDSYDDGYTDDTYNDGELNGRYQYLKWLVNILFLSQVGMTKVTVSVLQFSFFFKSRNDWFTYMVDLTFNGFFKCLPFNRSFLT